MERKKNWQKGLSSSSFWTTGSPRAKRVLEQKDKIGGEKEGEECAQKWKITAFSSA